MKKPDPNTPDNKLITSIFGTYLPRSQWTPAQRKQYYRVMSYIVSDNKARRTGLEKMLSDNGLSCPKIRSIIKTAFARPYDERNPNHTSKKGTL